MYRVRSPRHAVQLWRGASPLPASSSCSAAGAGSLPPACFLVMQCSWCREPPPCLFPRHAVQLVPGASPLPASSSCSAAGAGSLPPACFLFMQAGSRIAGPVLHGSSSCAATSCLSTLWRALAVSTAEPDAPHSGSGGSACGTAAARSASRSGRLVQLRHHRRLC